MKQRAPCGVPFFVSLRLAAKWLVQVVPMRLWHANQAPNQKT
jgi:hypothetical protein